MDKQCNCCCKSIPSSPHQQQWYQPNFPMEPYYGGYYCNMQNQMPQLRTMQKALVGKWRELDTLGHVADSYRMYRHALQQRLANESAQMDFFKNQYSRGKECSCPSNYNSIPRCTEGGMVEPYQNTNQLGMRRNLDHQNSHPQALKMYETQTCIGNNARSGSNVRGALDNQACICNDSENGMNYKGEEENQLCICNDTRSYQPPMSPFKECGQRDRCTFDCKRGREKSHVDDLREGIVNAVYQEKDIQRHLTDLRCEIGSLEAKIRSYWGSNVIDVCTPAAESRGKFF